MKVTYFYLAIALILNGGLVRNTPAHFSLDTELNDRAKEYIKKHGVILATTTTNPEILEAVRSDGTIKIDRGFTNDGKDIASVLLTALSLGLIPAPSYSEYVSVSFPRNESCGCKSGKKRWIG
jgi:hypothetical protein